MPAGRLGEPRELGELILYLANMQGTFHTGTVVKFAAVGGETETFLEGEG